MEPAEEAGPAYRALLKEFTQYKEKTVEEKEKLLKDLEKCKGYLDRFKDKVEKKWEGRVNDERTAGNQRLEREGRMYKRQISSLRQVLEVKDRLIEDLKNIVKSLEVDRKEIIETNTKMLLDINQDLSYPPAEGKYSHSYTELLRMYQYLIEENNDLKKQLKLKDKDDASILMASASKVEGKDKEKGKGTANKQKTIPAKKAKK